MHINWTGLAVGGTGWVEEGESHWQAPQGTLVVLGVGMMLAGWFLGKALDKSENTPSSSDAPAPPHRNEQAATAQESLNSEYPTDPQIDEMFKALESGDDQQVREVLRKRKREREAAGSPGETTRVPIEPAD